MIINDKIPKNKKHLEELEEPRKRNKTSKKKAAFLLVVCILLIVMIIVYTFLRNYNKDFNYMKEDISEHLVYTRYKINKQEVPYVNIKSKSITSVNKDIVTFCNNFKEYEKIQITYDYNINGKYLSLVIKVKTYGINDWNDLYFHTYNIDLKEKSYVSEENLLKRFDVTDELIEARIHNKFVEYYNDELEQGYLQEEECDYDCYIKYRGFNEYRDDISYYIKDHKLIVFKPFETRSIFGEEEYFNDESFEIAITE